MATIGEALVEHGLIIAVAVLLAIHLHRESVNHFLDVYQSGSADVLSRDRASDLVACVVNVKLHEQEFFKFHEKFIDRPVRQRSRPPAVAP